MGAERRIVGCEASDAAVQGSPVVPTAVGATIDQQVVQPVEASQERVALVASGVAVSEQSIAQAGDAAQNAPTIGERLPIDSGMIQVIREQLVREEAENASGNQRWSVMSRRSIMALPDTAEGFDLHAADESSDEDEFWPNINLEALHLKDSSPTTSRKSSISSNASGSGEGS